MKRNELNAARECAAEWLADFAGNAHDLTVDEARNLLHRCELYGSKSALMWERENDYDYYTRHIEGKNGEIRASWKHQLDLLDARRTRLENELCEVTGQCLKLHNYGLYPTIVCVKNGEMRDLPTLLHWAD